MVSIFLRAYPDISDIINDITGWHIQLPIHSFGFFVALAFLTAAWLLSKELKRKESEGLLQPKIQEVLVGQKATTSELMLNGLIGFVVGYKLIEVLFNYGACASNPQQFIFSLQGNFIGGIAGAFIGVWLKFREKKKTELPKPKIEKTKVWPHQMVGDIVVIAAFSGFLGAKVFSFLEDPADFRAFLHNPAEALFSGLTIYGGLIFGAIAVVWFSRRKNIKFFHLADAVAPSMMLGYAIGRIGCQVAGDGDWGIDNLLVKPGWLSWLPDSMWAYNYPHNILGEGVPINGCTGPYCNVLVNPVFPTPLYETIVCSLFFIVLWKMRKKIKIPGMLFAWYVLFNGFERFWIEKIRINTQYHIGNMDITQAEIISSLFILVAIGLFIYLKRSSRNKPIID